jgi:hypothetical protein
LSEFDDFVNEARGRVWLTIDSKVIYMVAEYRKLMTNPKSYE